MHQPTTPLIRTALAFVALSSLCAAQISLGPEQFISIPSRSVVLTVEDLDGDGLPDVLSDRLNFGQLRWRRNVDAGQRFEDGGAVSPLTLTAGSFASVRVADLDGDGDLDAVFDGSGADGLLWFENVDGAGTFGLGGRVAAGPNGALLLDPLDFDDDGDVDLMVKRSLGVGLVGIAWIPNVDGRGQFGEPVPLLEVSTSITEDRVLVTDLNGDEQPDVVVHAALFETPSWFENLGADAGFGEARAFGEIGQRIRGTADLDGDGDVDLLAHTNSQATWLENTDGAGTFAPTQTLLEVAPPAEYVSALTAADLDGDGDPDIVAATVGTAVLVVFENLDGTGTFGAPQEVSSQLTPLLAPYQAALLARDMDADGVTDVVLSTQAGAVWFSNDAGALTDPVVMTERLSFPRHVDLLDVDSDGDLDVVVGAAASGHPDEHFAWYERLDAARGFAPARTHGTVEVALDGLCTDWITDRDFTGDGHADLVTLSVNFAGPPEAASATHLYAWEPSLHDFQLLTVLDTGRTARNLESGDVDGDGIEDLLVQRDQASVTPGAPQQLTWIRGTGGGSFADPVVVFEAADLVSEYLITDADEDGDVDIVGSAEGALVLYEHLDGLGGFASAPQLLAATPGSPDQFSMLRLADVDGDGDEDILRISLSHAPEGAGVFWLEKLGASGFAPEQVLATEPFRVLDIVADDLDGDGRLDLVVTYELPVTGYSSIGWMAGQGAGAFAPLEALSNKQLVPAAFSIDVGDVDDDGAADIVVARSLQRAATWLRQGPAESPFTGLGGASPGAFGTANLAARGSMRPEHEVQLGLTAAPPRTPFFLILGTEVQLAAFHGGVLIPEPEVVLAPRFTDGVGAFQWTFRVPGDFKPFDQVLLQAWYFDPTAPLGFGASNALAATVLLE